MDFTRGILERAGFTDITVEEDGSLSAAKDRVKYRGLEILSMSHGRTVASKVDELVIITDLHLVVKAYSKEIE